MRAFDRTHLRQLQEMAAVKTDFEAFILDRFAAYTREFVVKARGVYGIANAGKEFVIEPIQDITKRDNAGYGHWHVDQKYLTEVDATTITVYHYTDGDRFDSGSRDRTFDLPLDWAFGEVEDDEDYKIFLRLREKYEGKR